MKERAKLNDERDTLLAEAAEKEKVAATVTSAEPEPDSQAEAVPTGPWACSLCTCLNEAHATVCIACDSPAPGAGKAWACAVCTCENVGGSPMCEACGTPNPAQHDAVVQEFVEKFVAEFKAAKRRDASGRAQVFETWEMFEISHDMVTVARAGTLIVKHESFVETLGEAIVTDARDGQLRDFSGTIFRLYGLWRDGALGLDSAEDVVHGERLDKAVSTILGAKQHQAPEHVGALYMQVLAPWLCAMNHGASDTLTDVVKHVGSGMVDWFKAQGGGHDKAKKVKSMMIDQYLQQARFAVWGSADEDVVYQAFYA